MSTIHHHHSSQPSPLDIRELADFDASLGEIPESEKRQRRIIYLRTAIQQTNISKTMFKGFGCLLIPFALIPLFWPFLFFIWFMKKKVAKMMDIQIDSALEYWKIDRNEIFSGYHNASTQQAEQY